MHFVDEIERRFFSYDLFGHGTLLAVSGGADSVALLLGMLDYARRRNVIGPDCLAVAHFNHGLRGAESDEDARFVRELAGRHALRYVEERWDAGSDGSSEAAARTVRYAFLTRTAERLGLRYVATAHTADDQVETVLHRILRGTGLAGLAGMSFARRLSDAATLVRPLLATWKAELLEELAVREQPFRTDASNGDLRFTRNRLRHTLLPLLREKFNPRVAEALLRLAAQTREDREFVEREAVRLLGRLMQAETDISVTLDRSGLAGEPEYLVREMFLLIWRRRGWPLRSVGAREWEMLMAALRRPDDFTLAFPGGVRIATGGHDHPPSSLVFERPVC